MLSNQGLPTELLAEGTAGPTVYLPRNYVLHMAFHIARAAHA